MNKEDLAKLPHEQRKEVEKLIRDGFKVMEVHACRSLELNKGFTYYVVRPSGMRFQV